MPQIDWSVIFLIAFVVLYLATWFAILVLSAHVIAGWIHDRWLK